jgi:hypothetical protein
MGEISLTYDYKGEISLTYDYNFGCNSGCMWYSELKFSLFLKL